MYSREILIFMVCPIAMAALWGALYYVLKNGFQPNESSILNFVVGLIVTLLTTFYVLINISNAKSEYSYHNIKLNQIAHFDSFKETTETQFDGEGNYYDLSNIWLLTVEDKTFKVDLVLGNIKEYEKDNPIYIYQYGGKVIISNKPIDDKIGKEIEHKLERYSIYYWCFLWIAFSAFFAFLSLCDTCNAKLKS